MTRMLAALLTIILLLITSAHAQELEATFVPATQTSLSNPHDLKLSPDGKRLFVPDVGNIRVVIFDAMMLAERGASAQTISRARRMSISTRVATFM